jgi:transcriptional regulator with XRE-family HTH domain
MFELFSIKPDCNSSNPKIRWAIASDDNKPDAILIKLSEDPDYDVRQEVASNPNTPIEILERLGAEFPESIINNPIFNILLLENPNCKFVRLSLARSSATSKMTLARLANREDDNDWDILWAIANNLNTPIEAFKQMNRHFILDFARTSYSSLQIFEKLARTEDLDILIAVVNNSKTPQYILEQLARSKYHLIRGLVGRNPCICFQISEELANDENNYVRVELARNFQLAPQVLEKLASDRNHYVRVQIAKNPNSSIQILEKLASDPDAAVQKMAKEKLAAKFNAGELRSLT